MELTDACYHVLKKNMDLKRDEKLLVIFDSRITDIAEAFLAAGKRLSDHVSIIKIPIGKESGEEPPNDVAREMKKYDVIILATTKSLSHTKARRDANSAGARIASMPGITEDMLLRNAEADYDAISKRTKKLAKMLTKGNNVLIKTDLGTNIRMSIKGRGCRAGKEGFFYKKGDFSNIPSGEADLSPVEGSAEGIFIVDKSFAGVGKLRHPIKVTVKKGFAVNISGGKEADKLKNILKKYKCYKKKAYNIAELGIGTNDAAVISGNVLEDEKVYGTVHIALGNNMSYGGKVDVPLHLDGVFGKPTVVIDGKVVIKEGIFLKG